MLDLSHIPNSQQDVKIFYASGTTNWQTWQKPRKCNYVYIMCIGGGGAGANGSTTSGLGAISGGGSGAVTRALFNASQLPDILYVQSGLGGLINGNPGNRSFVSILIGSTVAQNLVCVSGTTAATGGTHNNISTGETAATTAVANFLSLSNWISTAGIGSGTYPVAQTGPNTTPLSSQLTSPGAWGSAYSGATCFNGSSILSTSISPIILGGTASTAISDATNGSNGITSWNPFFSLGGAAGGSSGTNSPNGTGGNGGIGGIGSGGGGGSDGPIAAGVGGRGGDGLVIIITF